jgi:chemotaxis protein methyltransferase CheR
MSETIDSKKVVAMACALVEKATGVQFGAKQLNMVESRLKRHLAELGLDFSGYLSYYEQNQEKEKEALIALLTTHHTYFFREFVHFEFLEAALPALLENVKQRGEKTLSLWSAACSRGQEVYSLAMHLDHHLAGQPYSILGTDVDKDSVKVASNGVYKYDEIKEVPLTYLKQHWARGTGKIAEFAKVKKSLREHCEFLPGNLLDLAPFQNRKFDVIFCRNVFIYFTLDQVKQITEQLRTHLHPGGILILGLSESLHGLKIPMKAIGPSVYQVETPKKPMESGTAAAPTPVPAAPIVPKIEIPPVLKVVCIDDSTSILALMKKILVKDHGFQIVGTAENGEIGAKLVAELKPDLVTLDLHMPVCSGIEYLAKYHNASSPPVVVVSSVNREDNELAQKALKLGASDYVEKPALNNLKERAQELYAKLRTAHKSKGQELQLELDKTFAKTDSVENRDNCCRILICKNTEFKKVTDILREGNSALTYIAVEGSPKDFFDQLKQEGFTAQAAPSKPNPGAVSVGEIAMVAKATKNFAGKVSVMVFGSPKGYPELLQHANLQILAEDLGGGKAQEPYASRADDVLPCTSFSYLAQQFFAKKERKVA